MNRYSITKKSLKITPIKYTRKLTMLKNLQKIKKIIEKFTQTKYSSTNDYVLLFIQKGFSASNHDHLFGTN